MTTLRTPDSKELLNRAVDRFIEAVKDEEKPQTLYHLCYEQARGAVETRVDGLIHNLPDPSLSLFFDDSMLEPMKPVWEKVLGEAASEAEYMVFPDREGAQDEDELYH